MPFAKREQYSQNWPKLRNLGPLSCVLPTNRTPFGLGAPWPRFLLLLVLLLLLLMVIIVKVFLFLF